MPLMHYIAHFADTAFSMDVNTHKAREKKERERRREIDFKPNGKIIGT